MTHASTKRRANFAGSPLDIGKAVDWIASAASELSANERQLFGAQICVEELLANATRHGAAVAPSVSVSLEAFPDRLILTLEDDAAAFDLALAPIREFDESLENARPGGWGVALIRRFADNLTYRRTEKGNLIVLEFIR